MPPRLTHCTYPWSRVLSMCMNSPTPALATMEMLAFDRVWATFVFRSGSKMSSLQTKWIYKKITRFCFLQHADKQGLRIRELLPNHWYKDVYWDLVLTDIFQSTRITKFGLIIRHDGQILRYFQIKTLQIVYSTTIDAIDFVYMSRSLNRVLSDVNRAPMN